MGKAHLHPRDSEASVIVETSPFRKLRDAEREGMMFCKSAWLALLILSIVPRCLPQATPLPTSGVTGVVLTEDGQLGVGATVCTAVRHEHGEAISCQVPTDSEGRFVVQLRPGKYEVFAIDAGKGYSIENQSPGRDVSVTPDRPWPDVTIRQHARGGVLTGSITDKLTGRKIKNARLQITAIDGIGENSGTSVQPDFHLAVSPKCDLLVVVMAEGYRGWIYTDPSNPSRPVLHLASGGQKTLEIQLEPLPSQR